MKAIKLLLMTVCIGAIMTSCSVVIDDYDDPYYVSLEEVVTSYDLWYIDYNQTTGTGDIPFLSKAFTISFRNGRLYANNNLVGIGYTGNGYGIQVGEYDTFDDVLRIDHDLDGYFEIEVFQVGNDGLRLRDNYNNVTYYLEGYYKSTFDFDKVFYDNIEYFLQEYDAWEKTYTSQEGALNEFDSENFLAFTPENITTFYSSHDEVGTDIANIFWDYEGDYSVADVLGYDDLKILTLSYDSWGTEEFELSVINDGKISLYHVDSGTTYEFEGIGFIQYLKQSSKTENVRNDGRKRTKVQREVKIRKNRK